MQQQCNSGTGSKRSCSMEAHGGAPVTMMQCSCGGLVDPGPFPIFFANGGGLHEQQHRSDVDANPSSCVSPPVDCTLSLGTPSTRRQQPSGAATSKPSSSAAAAATAKHRNSFPLRFDFFRADQPKNMGGGDRVLLPRRCASCDTTSTPLWRNGPRGPKSLCNACGIRYKKEERRAASAAGNSSTTSSSCFVSSPAAQMEVLPPPPAAAAQHLTTNYGGYHHPWGYPAARLAAARKCPPSAILSAIALDENVDPMDAATVPYLPSWQRFGVAIPPPQTAEFAASRFPDYGLH